MTNSQPEILEIQVMPYSMMVGQEDLKLALELAFIAPKIGGVLLSGDRGTGKSTLVRSFGAMVNQKQPITLPINATEDRVVGGWDMQKIMTSNDLIHKKGLLEQAHKSILYIDEVNLLDDRIVNIIRL
jgi:magnesium chelatase subunit I